VDGNDEAPAQPIVVDAYRSIIIADLRPKRLLRCTMFAYGCQENSKVLDHELSK
jgi:hypothetical protein